jgi:hypothetical protein
MAIVINGSGTVTGLAVGGLPDGTVDAGTLATNSVDSAELIDGAVDDSHIAALAASKLTGTLPAIDGSNLTGISGGKVLQVVSVTTSSEKVTNSATFQDTAVTASITPSATSSKILVLLSVNGIYKNANNTRLRLKLQKNNSDLLSSVDDAVAVNDSTATMGVGGVSISHLDDTNTTSEVTYKVQIASSAGLQNVRINVNYSTSSRSSITLMEIGA